MEVGGGVQKRVTDIGANVHRNAYTGKAFFKIKDWTAPWLVLAPITTSQNNLYDLLEGFHGSRRKKMRIPRQSHREEIYLHNSSFCWRCFLIMFFFFHRGGAFYLAIN